MQTSPAAVGCHSGVMDRDRRSAPGDAGPPRDEADDRYHHEVDDPRDWDDDAFAMTGPVEAHGRGMDLGLLLLRLGSLLMVPHGLHKALDMEAFTAVVLTNLLGAQAPDLVAWLVMLSQVGLPLLIALGLFTRPAAFVLAGLMSAIWVLMTALRVDYTVLGQHGEVTGENALLYVALALPLVFTGAGRWSLDGLRTGGRP